jgi:hypothetical protein
MPALVEVPGKGLGAAGCNLSVPGQMWAASTWTVNGVLFGWFQTLANGFGCLDDSKAIGANGKELRPPCRRLRQ